MIRSSLLARWALGLMVLLAGSASLPAVDLLYVTMNDTVVTYDTTGNNGTAIAATKSIFASSNMNNANGLAIDSSKNVYVANFNSNSITKFNAAGAYVSAIVASSINTFNNSLEGPIGLAIDQSNNIYAANYSDYYYGSQGMINLPGFISKFDSSGNFTTLADQLTGGGGETTNRPFGLALDASGNLYAANYYGSSVTVFNSTGTFQKFISTSANPTGVAIDSNGFLYVTSETANKIQIYNTSGTLLSSITTNLNGPRGLTFDSSGNLYAANTGDKTISKFSSTGNFLTSWSTGTNTPAYLAMRPVTVPEPSTYALAVIATGVMAAIARRRKARRA